MLCYAMLCYAMPCYDIGVQNSKRVRVKKEESINKRPPDNKVFGLYQFWGDVWFLSLLVGRGKNCFWLKLSGLKLITTKTHQRPRPGSRFRLFSQDLVKMTVEKSAKAQSVTIRLTLSWQCRSEGFLRSQYTLWTPFDFCNRLVTCILGLLEIRKVNPFAYRGPKLEKG